MFASDKERDFFYSWFFRAQLDENFDADKQFFYFYALFDHLFKSYAKENESKLKSMGLSFKSDEKEKNKMRFYLFSLLYLNDEEVFADFNPFVMLRDCKKKQLIELLHNLSDSVFNSHNLPDFGALESLFLEIYKLRCELFHGEINLSNYNRDLYDEANMVLKDFFERLFRKNLSENK